MKDGLTDLVSCPVCYETDGEPKRLPCDHTYCDECLQKIVDKARQTNIACGRQPGKHINCPQCRRTVEIPGGKAGNLPTHLLMKQLREVIADNEGKDNKKPKCQLCDSVRNIETFCIDCKTSMCTLCSEKHTTRATFKDHTFRQISVFCQVHKSPSTLTCTDCQILLCLMCVNDGVCEDHDVRDVRDLSNDVIKDSDNLIEDIQEQIDDLTEDMQNKTQIIKEVKSDIANMKYLLLAANEAREKGVEHMIMATPVIMARLAGKKTKAVRQEGCVNIRQTYTMTKPALLIWQKEVPDITAIIFTPDNYLVAACNGYNFKQICMYDTTGDVISRKVFNKVSPFGLAHDKHTGSVIVACGEKGLLFYSDTDLEWKQSLTLYMVAEVTLNAHAVGVLSNSNLVVTNVNKDMDHTIGIYDRQGKVLNMIMKYHTWWGQLQVCDPRRITVLNDNTIVALMENKIVFLDTDLHCKRIIDNNSLLDVNKFTPHDIWSSSDGSTVFACVKQHYYMHETEHSKYHILHLLPNKTIIENGGLNANQNIYPIAIKDGNMAAVYKYSNTIKMFRLYSYIDIMSKNVKLSPLSLCLTSYKKYIPSFFNMFWLLYAIFSSTSCMM